MTAEALPATLLLNAATIALFVPTLPKSASESPFSNVLRKYPERSRIACVPALENTLIEPPVPTGTMISLAIVAPGLSQLITEAFGCALPVG